MRFPAPSRSLSVALAASAALLFGAASGLLGLCGPFTDVTDSGFCPYVLEIFTLGITTGTTPTTYTPDDGVSRLQMAAFLSRTVDQALARRSRRAALDQHWTTRGPVNLGLTTVGINPQLVESDGDDLWVANLNGGTVSRVRAGDGKLLETWTGAGSAFGVLPAMGGVFVTGQSTPGRLYRIDPAQTAGAVTTVASILGNAPSGIASDGSRIWTANVTGSVSIVTPGATIPWTVTTISTGFLAPIGALYDGTSIWVTDFTASTLLKLDSSGVILQTVPVASNPEFAVFDGANIWVPERTSASVAVVRASSGAVLATLTGNGLSQPIRAAFDGERVLVTNLSGNSVSLWKAANLRALGSFPTGAGTNPWGASSDGLNFWIVLQGPPGQLARF